jgi:hypothetical protein
VAARQAGNPVSCGVSCVYEVCVQQPPPSHRLHAPTARSVLSWTTQHATTQVSRKYGLARAPKLVEMIAAVPEEHRAALLPQLRAKPVRTASGVAVVAVMSKPHRCPHIATTGAGRVLGGSRVAVAAVCRSCKVLLLVPAPQDACQRPSTTYSAFATSHPTRQPTNQPTATTTRQHLRLLPRWPRL